MKTRIISGIVMVALAIAVLTVGYLWLPLVISLTVAALSAGVAFEIIHNAAGIKNKVIVTGVCVYAAITIIADYYLGIYGAVTTTVLYLIFAAFMILKRHADFDLAKIALVYAMPLPFVFAFLCFGSIIVGKNGLYHLLLLLNFSCVCDMGAYFTGVTVGKTKLCPQISPNKTVEGAVGGIVLSLIVTLVISLIFNRFNVLTLIFTIPFCVLGMLGDLFASAIKRSVGLKDYSNLIPGHGGVLDRFDSMIMIIPAMFVFVHWSI